ncbi:hypothetical protein MASR2M16_14880 [Thauera terpenica]|jgi:hypothetical protein
MWIMLSNSFLSIVDKAVTPGCLVVRARVAGHIEAVFPDAAVSRTPGNDYLFRAEILRERVATALAEQVRSIDYANYKGSVADDAFHDALMDVWRAMADLQEVSPYGRRAR